MTKKEAIKELGQALLIVIKSEIRSAELLEIALTSGMIGWSLLRGKGATSAATHMMGPLKGPLRFLPGNLVRIVLILGGLSLLYELLEKAEAHLKQNSEAFSLSQNIRAKLQFVNLHRMQKSKASTGL